jgi:O-antigen/teichoic acid export membrane protein
MDSTLRQRAFSAGKWTLLGYGLTQGMRFAGNVVLTRLLFPEAFGLMALAQSVLVGLTMLSDAGTDQFIIQNRQGHIQRFTNVAFTMQSLRGIFIWI